MRWRPRHGARLRSLATALAGGAATALVLYRVFPQHVPHDGHPGFVETIFASTIIVFGARVVLLAVAAMLVAAVMFVVLSIRERARAGQWIATFGPFDTGLLDEAAGGVHIWQAALRRAEGEAADLAGEVASLRAANAVLREQVGRLGGSAGKHGA